VDPAQAVVGGERLALDQADGGQLAGPLGVQGLGRFFLDKVVDLLLEPEVVGMHGVEVELGPVDPLVGGGSSALARGRSWFLHVGHAAHADGAQPAPQGDQGCPGYAV
jgi:hypothetical protein